MIFLPFMLIPYTSLSGIIPCADAWQELQDDAGHAVGHCHFVPWPVQTFHKSFHEPVDKLFTQSLKSARLDLWRELSKGSIMTFHDRF